MKLQSAFEVAEPQKISNSILSFSHGAVMAFRFFSKEDMLSMMSDMTLAEIAADLQRFRDLKEDKICEKIRFVMDVKGEAEVLSMPFVKK
ncbi:MAG: hypothetical protein JWQ25_2596 [Daejeonella sp.]|nr:hypothetical protein [Daejeonella sp.]